MFVTSIHIKLHFEVYYNTLNFTIEKPKSAILGIKYIAVGLEALCIFNQGWCKCNIK